MDFSCALFTSAHFFRFRFRFLVFPVRMWLFPVLARRIPPLPVAENRFDAPRLLFIFGITVPPVSPPGPASFPPAGGGPPPVFWSCRVSRICLVFPVSASARSERRSSR